MIDEVSMLDGDLFEKLEAIGRRLLDPVSLSDLWLKTPCRRLGSSRTIWSHLGLSEIVWDHLKSHITWDHLG